MTYVGGMALEHDKTFQMRASEAFLRDIDDWRRQQPEIPSRAEAIRQLIKLGLAATKSASHPSAGSRSARVSPGRAKQ